jgi:MerR family transcriptional regulator, activator of bmr gene
MKSNSMYSIGEVSKMKGITIKALRFYHQLGLLIPYYIDPHSGYRYYYPHQFIIIDIIQIAKKLGAPLESIKDTVNAYSIEKLIAFIHDRNQEIEIKLKEIKEAQKNLNAIKEALRLSQNNRQKNFVSEFLDVRYALTIPLVDQSIESEMLAYSKLTDLMNELKVQRTYVTGSILEFNKTEDEFIPVRIFQMIHSKHSLNDHPNVMTFPSGYYLNATYTSTHRKTIQQELMTHLSIQNIVPDMVIELDTFENLIDFDDYTANLQVLMTQGNG